jgi:hypothetical protein
MDPQLLTFGDSQGLFQQTELVALAVSALCPQLYTASHLLYSQLSAIFCSGALYRSSPAFSLLLPLLGLGAPGFHSLFPG